MLLVINARMTLISKLLSTYGRIRDVIGKLFDTSTHLRIKGSARMASLITTSEIKQIGIPRAAFEYVIALSPTYWCRISSPSKKKDNSKRHDAA